MYKAPPKVILTGLAVGHTYIPGLIFDKNKTWCCCFICGTMFQSDLDRTGVTEQEVAQAAYKRRLWRATHARKHTIREHELLKASGNAMTPEAANRLAAFGVISMIDAVLSDEINHALFESSPIPIDDCQS